MVKIYTRGGDKGETSLIGGKRTSKSSARIHAYGSIDELNSAIGVAISFIEDKDVKNVLGKVQSELFIVGSDLADPSYPENPNKIPRVSDEMVKQMEGTIDKYEGELEAIQYFILPGGTREAALLHLARGIARRAERVSVELSSSEPVNPSVIAYLNRLSSLLFVFARLLNKNKGVKDVAWRV
ncbi:MAG: cob(I)alamin adenosyltransferase [Candidatus Nitrosomirales archaeon]|jgi:cob(I)alamin adenosyltransferase